MEISETEVINLCRQLRLSTMAKQILPLQEAAERQKYTHLQYVGELLEEEFEQRAIRKAANRVRAARFPQIKTLEGFDFTQSPHIQQGQILKLSKGEYIDKAEPIIFIGEPGSGKTHLATALGYAAAQQGVSVRFVTASFLANSLIEAKDAHVLSKLTMHYQRYDVLIIDELGYLPLNKADAELIFQVLSGRQEQRPVIITTNLPFSEWTNVFPDQRLCRALIDRLTHRAHIIETGEISARLRETLDREAKKDLRRSKKS